MFVRDNTIINSTYEWAFYISADSDIDFLRVTDNVIDDSWKGMYFEEFDIYKVDVLRNTITDSEDSAFAMTYVEGPLNFTDNVITGNCWNDDGYNVYIYGDDYTANILRNNISDNPYGDNQIWSFADINLHDNILNGNEHGMMMSGWTIDIQNNAFNDNTNSGFYYMFWDSDINMENNTFNNNGLNGATIMWGGDEGYINITDCE